MRTTRNWPARPIGMPIRSIHFIRMPRSRKKWRVPWKKLASQGAPMKPIHRPRRVTTTYHSGGTEAVAMAWSCAPVSPAIAPPMAAKMTAPIWPARKPMTPKRSQNHAWRFVVGGTQGVSRNGVPQGGLEGRRRGRRRERGGVPGPARVRPAAVGAWWPFPGIPGAGRAVRALGGGGVGGDSGRRASRLGILRRRRPPPVRARGRGGSRPTPWARTRREPGPARRAGGPSGGGAGAPESLSGIAKTLPAPRWSPAGRSTRGALVTGRSPSEGVGA